VPIALEITLILVLVAVAVALVPLLYQLRKSAQAMDLFLLSTKLDLAQIAEDVHASRLRMDHLASTLQSTLYEFSVFAKSVGELGGWLKELQTNFRTSLESASRNFGGIIGGISAVLAFLKTRQTPHEPE
jgi:uncharacterized protein YoxC